MDNMLQQRQRKDKRVIAVVLSFLLIFTTFSGVLVMPTKVKADTKGPVVEVILPHKSIEYMENGEPVLLAEQIEIKAKNSEVLFSGGFFRFEIDDMQDSEILALQPGEYEAKEIGVIKIKENGDILLNGEQIGQINTNDNGEGKPLQIDFIAPLENGDFKEVGNDNLPIGWVINTSSPGYSNQVWLGDLATKTKGKELISVTDNSNGMYTVKGEVYDAVYGGYVEYSFDTDFYYNPNDKNNGKAWKLEGKEKKLTKAGTKIKQINDNDDKEPERGNVLELGFMTGNVEGPRQTEPYGSAFGPEAISTPFVASAGDKIAFDWRAYRGSNDSDYDDYEVYGFLYNIEKDEYTELMYGRGKDKPWTTATSTILEDGNYQFRFVAGSYDRTGGLALGATLRIDNVRLLKSVVNELVVQFVARQIIYMNNDVVGMAEKDITLRNVTVTAADSEGRKSKSDSENTVKITLKEKAPTITLAILDQADIGGKIHLTFDKDITLENLNGFTITIDGKNIDLTGFVKGNDYEIDDNKLIITFPEETNFNNIEKVEVNYQKNEGNLIGTTMNKLPVEDFFITVEDEFSSQLIITEPKNTIIYVAKPPIKGMVEEGSLVNIIIKDNAGNIIESFGGTAEVDNEGNWSFTPNTNLPDGDYVIEVTAIKGSKIATKTKDMTINTKPPILEITTPPNEVVKDNKLLISGNTEPNAEVSIVIKDENGKLVSNAKGEVTADEKGNWQFIPSVSLTDGEYVIEVISTKDGKVSTSSKEIFINTSNVNKDALRAKVKEGKTLNNDDYTEDSWSVAEPELTAAKTILNNPDATQVEIDKAFEKLAKAIDALKLKKEVKQEAPVVKKFAVNNVAPNKLVITLDKPISLDDALGFTLISNKDGIVPINTDNYTLSADGYTLTLNLARSVGHGELLTLTYNENEGNVVRKDYEDLPLASFTGKIVANNVAKSRSSSGSSSKSSGDKSKDDKSNIKTTNDGEEKTFATGTIEGDTTVVKVDADKIKEQIDNGSKQELVINYTGEGNLEVTDLTVDTLTQMQEKSTNLVIDTPLAKYPVPNEKINHRLVAGEFGNPELSDIKVNIIIAPSSKNTKSLAEAYAQEKGYELRANPVKLDLSFTYDGKTIRVDKLDSYGVKYIRLPDGIDGSRITTGVVVYPDGTIFHVPTEVVRLGNHDYAKINDLRTHAEYSVIWNPKDFSDVRNHWAKDNANDMGARIVVEGIGNNLFAPNSNVTRAEFAAFVARGLGLMHPDVAKNNFPDIAKNDWYHDPVTIANEFDIVKGYDDGYYRGNHNITREQGIAIINRAYNLIAPSNNMGLGEADSVLANYRDGSQVSNWAKVEVAKMINKGIVKGTEEQKLNPQDNMTRAEAASLIRRILQKNDLINR